MLTLSDPVPDRACTVALRFSLITLLSSPKASLALSSLNTGLPVMPRYSCAGNRALTQQLLGTWQQQTRPCHEEDLLHDSLECSEDGGGARDSTSYLVFAGVVDNPLLGLAHHTEHQRLALLRSVCSDAKIDLLRARVFLESLCSTQGCQCIACSGTLRNADSTVRMTRKKCIW